MTRLTRTILPIALLPSLLLAGCGGSGKEDTATTTPTQDKDKDKDKEKSGGVPTKKVTPNSGIDAR